MKLLWSKPPTEVRVTIKQHWWPRWRPDGEWWCCGSCSMLDNTCERVDFAEHGVAHVGVEIKLTTSSGSCNKQPSSGCSASTQTPQKFHFAWFTGRWSFTKPEEDELRGLYTRRTHCLAGGFISMCVGKEWEEHWICNKCGLFYSACERGGPVACTVGSGGTVPVAVARGVGCHISGPDSICIYVYSANILPLFCRWTLVWGLKQPHDRHGLNIPPG